MKKLYEMLFIARQEMSPAQVESLTKELASHLEEEGGKVGKTEYCALRTLAYPIKKNTKGHYILMNMEAEPKAMAELERKMGLNESILRFLTLVVEAHEDGPSALLKASRYGREETDRKPRQDAPMSRTPSGRVSKPAAE